MEKKLSVKNLKISFRTANGKVQAVRNITFDLFKGETLAIVGESGSGKSVTSKAVLGISSNNAIIESGEIIYDGKDLLKITEDDFHSIRGDKIAMIFQDPMSSLNPIMRIGNQLTEAMILKNKVNRKESRKTFNKTMALLLECTIKADIGADINVLSKKFSDFDKFEYKHIELESAYNDAFESCQEAVLEIENLIFEIERKGVKDIVNECKDIVKLCLKTNNRFVLRDISLIEGSCNELINTAKTLKKQKDYSPCLPILQSILSILKPLTEVEEKPNFFGLGYYLTYIENSIPELPVKELNETTHKILDETFMLDFIETVSKGINYSHTRAIHNANIAIEVLNNERQLFTKELNDKELVKESASKMIKAVRNSINLLSLIKDSLSYTFASSLNETIDRYFVGVRRNDKELERFNKQTAKRQKMIDNGKTPDFTVVPADIIDLDETRNNIIYVIDNMSAHLKKLVYNHNNFDLHSEVINMIDFLKEKASSVVYKVTKNMAKNKALKLMEEVGIAEARKRFNQYPFQFSGGMRQRIVIAIALAANPDILICDEPTTALDVTIQAQILELINDLKLKRNLSVIFITHDLGVVANMADKIAVMYAGKIVEYGTSHDVFYDPRHPYTWALLSSMPDLDTNEKLEAIPGTPPNMIYPPVGDAFAARNKYAMKIDFEEEPPLFDISETHKAATWLLHPDAPKVNPPKNITDRIARMKKLGEQADEQ